MNLPKLLQTYLLMALCCSSLAVANNKRNKLGSAIPMKGEVRDKFQQNYDQISLIKVIALKRALNDMKRKRLLNKSKLTTFERQLNEFEGKLPKILTGLKRKDQSILEESDRLLKLQRNLLLSNPHLDFDEILVVKRRKTVFTRGDGQVPDPYGLPENWQGNTNLKPDVWENSIVKFPVKSPTDQEQLVYKPQMTTFVGDMDLNFDGDKLLFTGIDKNKNWQIYEVGINGGNVVQKTDTPKDISNYEPMYLPTGKIMFNSTTGFQGVPCVGGKDYVGNLHLMNQDGSNIRRLTFDQDNNWDPTMMNNGKVMYQRWEYTDSAHYFSRVMMQMNPDGTGQIELYGSNSYWPNSIFYARPLPGSSSKFVGIVTGHHGTRRQGELVIFDTNLGRTEATGAVQRIPGYGKKVIGPIKDRLVDPVWPKFLHPYPISDKHFLVACQPTKNANIGIYLVDIWDNMLMLREDPNYWLIEPIPVKKRRRPPVVPDRVNLKDKEATIFIADIYEGRGMVGVPKGVVKSIRVFQYEYAYRNMGGHYTIGMEGCWNVRRIIGTAPVYADGSTSFKVPANVPLSLQPLDEEGKAVSQMRSWLTAMPGEVLACVGCHENQGQAPINQTTIASSRQPFRLKPWFGPTRGFSFLREVQPVLDRKCVGCHDGTGKKGVPNFKDISIDTKGTDRHLSAFAKSYNNLHPYVRRTGPEGDYTGLTAAEFHADTSELVQLLQKGHHNVKLSPEEWNRITTWIDLNVPFYGTWTEASTGVIKRPSVKLRPDYVKKRYELKKQYANVDEDIEVLPLGNKPRPKYKKPDALPQPEKLPELVNWPLKNESITTERMSINLGNNVKINLRKIPTGQFVMGSNSESPKEQPATAIQIDKSFWMAETEISLEQFQQFRKSHKNGYYDMHMKDQIMPGLTMDNKKYPAIRVSWTEANAFCRWLSKKSGRKVRLPSEAQWEWACRAGTNTHFWFGDHNANYGKFANLSDVTMKNMATNGAGRPIRNASKYIDFIPKDLKVNDKVLHLAPVNQYQANPWGIKQMHGNVAEWTRSLYKPYPFEDSITNEKCGTVLSERVVRGGSWRDRARFSSSSYRLAYPAWQKVYNVGFRIIVE